MRISTGVYIHVVNRTDLDLFVCTRGAYASPHSYRRKRKLVDGLHGQFVPRR